MPQIRDVGPPVQNVKKHIGFINKSILFKRRGWGWGVFFFGGGSACVGHGPLSILWGAGTAHARGQGTNIFYGLLYKDNGFLYVVYMSSILVYTFGLQRVEWVGQGVPKTDRDRPPPPTHPTPTPPLEKYAFDYKINDFLYLLAQVDQTPLFLAHALAQGKDGISGFLYKNIGFLYFGYICSILFIYFSVLVILLSYKWWDGRAPNQGFRVTPTNGIETIYGKAW